MKRDAYAVSRSVASHEGIVLLVHALLDFFQHQLHGGRVDAVVDTPYRDALPPEVEDAQRVLLKRGERQRRDGGKNIFGRWRHGDPAMAVELNLTDPNDLALFRAFASYSIYADAYGRGGERLIHVVDSGEWVMFDAEKTDVDDIMARTGMRRSFIEPGAWI